ncbi:MAG: hypothetical protein V2B20_27800 [Pseudomonadota bacterium]
MQSMTYTDIIDDKITEWQSDLKKREALTAQSSETQALLSAKTETLKSAINKAITQLRDLDAQETVGNTMATKDKILQIFTSIDKALIEHEEKTPFML